MKYRCRRRLFRRFFVGVEEFPEDDERTFFAFANLAAEVLPLPVGGPFVGFVLALLSGCPEQQGIDAAIGFLTGGVYRMGEGVPRHAVFSGAFFERSDESLGDLFIDVRLG